MTEKDLKKSAKDKETGSARPESAGEPGGKTAEKEETSGFGALPRCPDNYCFEDGM